MSTKLCRKCVFPEIFDNRKLREITTNLIAKYFRKKPIIGYFGRKQNGPLIFIVYLRLWVNIYKREWNNRRKRIVNNVCKVGTIKNLLLPAFNIYYWFFNSSVICFTNYFCISSLSVLRIPALNFLHIYNLQCKLLHCIS